MLNVHNTRGVSGRVRRGLTAAGSGAPGILMPNPAIPIMQIQPVNPANITFNPVYLASVEQDAEDLLYAETTIAELAIIPGEPLEMMRVKARQLKENGKQPRQKN